MGLMAVKRTGNIFAAKKLRLKQSPARPPQPKGRRRALKFFGKALETIGKPIYWGLVVGVIALGYCLLKLGGSILTIGKMGLGLPQKLRFPKFKLPLPPRPSKKWLWLVSPICLLALICLLAYLFIFKDFPHPNRLITRDQIVSTKIYDRYGQLLYKIYRQQNRTLIPLSEIPLPMIQATIAIEDAEFYHHRGLSFKGIIRAFFQNLKGNKLYGGSTITQQLVKNALLSPERTIKRKIIEILLSLWVEQKFSKDEILQMYFNEVGYGGAAYGAEEAAQMYFGKSVKKLNLAEAALLAGLPAAPTTYSPFGAHPEKTKERQKLVLKRMREEKFITRQEEEEAKRQELHFAPQRTDIRAPHFVMYIKELLVKKYGLRMVEEGGLEVITSLDLEIQNKTQQIVKKEIKGLRPLRISNGAALVTNPRTGEILAMVGSKDYFDQEIDGKVNVTLMPRQPGSAIKPLNYALALEKKIITPATVINDVPTCFTTPGQPLYCPVNYDGQFHGPVQVRFALGNSYNLPAVKVLTLNGLEDFIAKAKEMGITTFKDPSRYGLSLTLGGGEVKMIDLATAFSAFANSGIRQDLYAIQKVETLSGKVLYERKESEGPRVLPMAVAYLISHILLDNNARSAAFGSGSYLVIKNHPEVSVKTGTTNDKRDNWTIGWTPSRLVAVWVGNNDNTPMSYVASGITGASPIWNQIMSHLLEKTVQEWPLKPEGVVGAHICALSGQTPHSENPCQTRFEYFLKGTVPEETKSLNQFVEVDKTTGQLATNKTPPENRELQEHPVITDPLGTHYCLDCPPPSAPIIISPTLREVK